MITSEIELSPGDRGYVRRNDHDPKYLQVVTSRDSFIHGYYISEKDAVKCLEINNPIMEHENIRRINGLWSSYWKAKFQK